MYESQNDRLYVFAIIVGIRVTLAASSGERAISAKNSAEAEAARYTNVL